jgi:hypothetical protein
MIEVGSRISRLINEEPRREFDRDQVLGSREGKNGEDRKNLLPLSDAPGGGDEVNSWLTVVLDPSNSGGHPLFFMAILFAMGLLVSFTIVLTILIGLPPDYFATSDARKPPGVERRALAWVGVVLKTLLGATLVILGVVLSFPGVPGQGLLTILAGLLLLEFPGKRGLLLRILRRPFVLRAINRLRAAFSRPPLAIG